MTSHPKKVLVAPLDWGMGHATRCVPVIRELISQNAHVILAASGRGQFVLKNEFPQLKFIELPGINIVYPANGSMAWHMFRQSGKMLRAISREHVLLQKMLETHTFTHVISDNRYGLHTTKARTVFISHQVKVKAPVGLKIFEPLLHSISNSFIHRFDELWIPDIESDNSLSGDLSDCSSIKIPVKYTGVLSRFKNSTVVKNKKYDIILLLSGPEPQRTEFENIVVNQLRTSGKKSLVIKGRPESTDEHREPDIDFVNTITDDLLVSLLHPETLLIVRPGYSTLMDLTVLHHSFVCFVPTPGQTEQEYLAEYHAGKNGCNYMLQKSFNLDDALKINPGSCRLGTFDSTNNLPGIIGSFLNAQ